jgi:hypothetical protein
MERSFTEISVEKYSHNLYESIFYYKQKKSLEEIDLIHRKIMKCSYIILEDMMDK